ncbi:hypothetical protein CON94_21710 [Bacillus pseudomycoides]|uniref:hypothetical protein n=1 Tax=Bacillus pseudomycoides TaxID=64104 RepID=UPI000BEBC4F2|nr:hypothetical protein [Bacillus pseudomycoides]PEF73298.1 hypothetical protein CON94_21710 [Bacillus pseudomycoides]PEL78239.1 hypothetical protein CN615_26555 [Bacillus pseudomycoides]PGE93747.1 hypothetical protein COM62_26705 [Bacillus pseudomycoides]PHB18472.1 hypothetical protein COE80_25455 [Bacillus pseudomycoides]PHE36031.1 hypothetical protein COF51_23220 [Bacillus pseudomycoides]
MKKLFHKKWWLCLFSTLIIASIGVIVFLNYTKEKKIQTTKEPIDKKIYQQELKSQIDLLTTNYDTIVEQEWLPTWTELNSKSGNINTTELLDKMNNIANQFNEISKKTETFKAEEKMKDPALKQKINHFKTAFIASSNCMENAALSITQGLNNEKPLKDSLENATQSLGLADQNIVMALSTLAELEGILGITKK